MEYLSRVLTYFDSSKRRYNNLHILYTAYSLRANVSSKLGKLFGFSFSTNYGEKLYETFE